MLKYFIVLLVLMISNLMGFGQSWDSSEIELKSYQGLGILKVYNNDVVRILPDTAFIINKEIYGVGLEAVEFVKQDKCNILLNQQSKRYKLQSERINELTTSLDKLTLQHEALIEESEAAIKEINELNNQYQFKISELENSMEVQKHIFEKQRRKNKNKTFALIGTAIAATVAVIYF